MLHKHADKYSAHTPDMLHLKTPTYTQISKNNQGGGKPLNTTLNLGLIHDACHNQYKSGDLESKDV